MNIGLKLWSVNTDCYYDEAIRLYNEGFCNYIELYVVPNTLDTLDKWKKTNIPFIIHAPHFAHGINLADPDKLEYNKKIYNEVEIFRKEINAKYTIIHSGIDGSIEEVIRQLKIIKPKNSIVENKPYQAPIGEKRLCRGYSTEEISKVMIDTGCGFCLDIGHAICAANSQGKEPYFNLIEFEKLKPTMYHVSGNDIRSSVDRHLHFSQGNYDYQKIFSIIDCNKPISIETNKDSKTDLYDFETDVIFCKENIRNEQ